MVRVFFPLQPLTRALASLQPWQCFYQDRKAVGLLWLLPNRLGVTSVTLQELVLLMLALYHNIRMQEQTFLTWTTQMKSSGKWSRFPAWRKWMPHLETSAARTLLFTRFFLHELRSLNTMFLATFPFFRLLCWKATVPVLPHDAVTGCEVHKAIKHYPV